MSYPQNDIKDTRGVQLRPIAQSQSEEAFIYSSLLPNDIDSKSSHHDPIQRSSRTFSSSWVQTPNQILSNTAWFRRHFWIDTWHDVKQFPYTWLARRFISHFLPPSVLLCLVALLVLMSVQPTNFLTDIDNVCKPDGSFKLLGMGEYTPWQRGAIFAINSNFGSYSFSVAKLIDIIWDVVSCLSAHESSANYLGYGKRRSSLPCYLHLHCVHKRSFPHHGSVICDP